MQLVIEISDERYKEIVESNKPAMIYRSDVAKVLVNGIPLPKGHGRLGDLDALREEVSSWGMNDYEPLDFIDAIDQADTIIEAESEDKEKNDAI